jgi:hypothetical protein
MGAAKYVATRDSGRVRPATAQLGPENSAGCVMHWYQVLEYITIPALQVAVILSKHKTC